MNKTDFESMKEIKQELKILRLADPSVENITGAFCECITGGFNTSNRRKCSSNNKN